MDIDEFTSKILDRIAKTKEDSLLFGGFILGFAVGITFFSAKFNFDLIGILEILIINILLFLGILLVVRGKRTIREEDIDILQDKEDEK